MGSRKKSKTNVIIASFPDRAKEGRNQSGQSATIVPFEKSEKTMADKSTEFQPEDYLDWLAEQKYVNPFEEKKLRAAAESLFRKYPKMTLTIRNQVQDEFTGENTSRFTVIADEEEGYWLNALKRGREPLPGFDYTEARAIFTAPPEERTSRVAFLKPEFAADVPVVDIRRELAGAAAFFHIILRMVRKQHEKDHPAPQSTLDGLIDDLLTEKHLEIEAFPEKFVHYDTEKESKPKADLPAEEDFVRVELNEVLRKPSPPEPPVDDEWDGLSNLKALAEELRQLEEELKRLHPRKPTLWRKLLDRFRKK